MKSLLSILLAALFLCFTAPCDAQVTQFRSQYKVKKKDTMYGIARQHGITVEELVEANPEMGKEGYTLKKGAVIFIPYARDKQAPTPATPAPKAQRDITIGVMLPLHDVDGDGRRMTEYYRGLLMACDSLRAKGISTNIHTWNVDAKADISKFTALPAAAKCDIIFGPLYTTQVHALAEFCKARDIKMVIPFSINGDAVSAYSQIFQVYQSPQRLNDGAIDYYMRLFPDCHAVFIDCNDKSSDKGAFTYGLRNRLDGKGITYSVTNLNNSEGALAKAFVTGKRNIVILNTARSPELTQALAKLEKVAAAMPQAKISLFGYTEWLMYLGIDQAKFHRFDTYIPCTYYYNPDDPRTQGFEQNYKRWFKADMMHALPRFALTGYDQGRFFIEGFSKLGKQFKGTKGQSDYTPLQTKLLFQPVGAGGAQNAYFQLVHYTPQLTIETLSY